MKRRNLKPIMLSTLLLTGNAYAAGPGFDGIDVNSGTTGTLSGCPAGTSTCTTLIEGEGFLQQEVAVGSPTPFIQTVIIDPLPATSTTVVTTLPTVDPNDTLVVWLGQSIERFDPLFTTTVTATGPITRINPNTFNIPDVALPKLGVTNFPPTDQPGNFGAFKPGSHLLSWQTPFQEDTQLQRWNHVLNVLPLVSFGTAETITASEGSQVTYQST